MNNRPVIGILAQESKSIQDCAPTCSSFIAASYVKFIECAGARVVPIMIGREKSYYEKVMRKINGVLLPGGATYFTEEAGYAVAGEHIYKIAIDMNDSGDKFPLWGTCLGFELLLYLSAGSVEHRSNCKNLGRSQRLRFKEGHRKARLYGDNVPEGVAATLVNQDSSTFYHQYCITEKTFEDLKLDRQWKVLSVNSDEEGLEFISSIESKRYPFYGVQFHPEKNIFEWSSRYAMNTSASAIASNRYFADFFVAEARLNGHTFEECHHENDDDDLRLIYDYPVRRCAGKYEQCYLFGESANAQVGRPKL